MSTEQRSDVSQFLAHPSAGAGQDWIVWDRAKGATIWDIHGKEYIDFCAGTSVVNIGHAHPRLVNDLQAQVAKLINCYDAPHPTRGKTARRLAQLTGGRLETVIMVTTGSEAVDAALKAARVITGKFEFVSFLGAFHGRAWGGVSTAGLGSTRRTVGPTVPGIMFAPYPDGSRFGRLGTDEALEWVDAMVAGASTGSLAGVIVEPFQGSGGAIVPPPDFLPRLHEWCREHDALMIVDEVQASFGRTGSWLAVDQLDVEPDILLLGKAISSGVPTAAVLTSAELGDQLPAGLFSSTYGGNPLSCAATLATIDVLEAESLPQRARELGLQMLKRIDGWPETHRAVGAVRGWGMTFGLTLHDADGAPDPLLTKRVLRGVAKEGVCMMAPSGPHGNILRITPPLVLEEERAERGLEILESVIERESR